MESPSEISPPKTIYFDVPHDKPPWEFPPPPVVVPEDDEEQDDVIGLCSRIMLFLRVYWKSIVLILIPLVFMPIAYIGDQKASECLYVMCIMSVFWVTEALPLAITSILPIILFPILGVLSSEECCYQYITDITLIFIGMFTLGQAFEYCILDQRIALKILKLVGCRPRQLHWLLVYTSYFISMFVINVAVVAIMCPIVKALVREMEVHGLCRQFDDDVEEEPRRPSKISMAFYFGISYGALFGGTSTLIGTGSNEAMVEVYEYSFNESIPFWNFLGYSMPVMFTLCTVSVVYLQWKFMGLFNESERTNEALDCHFTPEAVERTRISVEKEYTQLGPLEFHEKVVISIFVAVFLLFLTRSPGPMTGWNGWFDENVSEATPATLVIICLVVFPSHPSFMNYFKKDSQYLPIRRSRGAISWQFVRNRTAWKILFLLGGGFALAEGSRVTQMHTIIATALIQMRVPDIFLSFILCFPVFLMTQIFGNAALSFIILPIVVDVADCHVIHHTYLIVPASLVVSFSFTTAVGTAANALVVGFSNIRGYDMAITGLAPAIMSFVVVWLSFPIYGALFFPDIRRPYLSRINCDNVTGRPSMNIRFRGGEGLY